MLSQICTLVECCSHSGGTLWSYHMSWCRGWSATRASPQSLSLSSRTIGPAWPDGIALSHQLWIGILIHYTYGAMTFSTMSPMKNCCALCWDMLWTPELSPSKSVGHSLFWEKLLIGSNSNFFPTVQVLPVEYKHIISPAKHVEPSTSNSYARFCPLVSQHSTPFWKQQLAS